MSIDGLKQKAVKAIFKFSFNKTHMHFLDLLPEPPYIALRG